ncbi:hypothetical protein ANN_13751 [Periplaneta americana]|uniref:Uncharacterized protein n=1 Tax=Periplaneta americana TaxID=6978 RepID=A0ABQ8SUY9_PERAM|nr:hypothetical protein ANN_13751 [Periplaneta americana]
MKSQHIELKARMAETSHCSGSRRWRPERLEFHCQLLSGGLIFFFIENGEVVNRPIPGRPPISTKEEDAMLLREVQNHPFRTASQLKSVIRCRRAVRMEHAVDRLAYATLRQDFDWRNVIFSDQVIVSSSNDVPALVYRIDGHRYDERFMTRFTRTTTRSEADELWDRVLDAWEEVAMNLDLFHDLVDSMLPRIRAVVDAGVSWVCITTGRRVLKLRIEEMGIQIWRIAANILNKQSGEPIRDGPPAWEWAKG